MDKQKVNNSYTIYFIIGIILIIGLVFCCSYLIYENTSINFQKEYYKEQMLNFCEMSKAEYELLQQYDNSIILDSLNKDCSAWLIQNI